MLYMVQWPGTCSHLRVVQRNHFNQLSIDTSYKRTRDHLRASPLKGGERLKWWPEMCNPACQRYCRVIARWTLRRHTNHPQRRQMTSAPLDLIASSLRFTTQKHSQGSACVSEHLWAVLNAMRRRFHVCQRTSVECFCVAPPLSRGGSFTGACHHVAPNVSVPAHLPVCGYR